jgi:hypothetical protein
VPVASLSTASLGGLIGLGLLREGRNCLGDASNDILYQGIVFIFANFCKFKQVFCRFVSWRDSTRHVCQVNGAGERTDRLNTPHITSTDAGQVARDPGLISLNLQQVWNPGNFPAIAPSPETSAERAANAAFSGRRPRSGKWGVGRICLAAAFSPLSLRPRARTAGERLTILLLSAESECPPQPSLSATSPCCRVSELALTSAFPRSSIDLICLTEWQW